MVRAFVWSLCIVAGCSLNGAMAAMIYGRGGSPNGVDSSVAGVLPRVQQVSIARMVSALGIAIRPALLVRCV